MVIVCPWTVCGYPFNIFKRFRHLFNVKTGPGWLNELGSWITWQIIQAYNQYGVGSRPTLFIAKQGAPGSQPQVIKFTSCLSMVGGSLRVLRRFPQLKLVAMI
jgi:hypothetical protein